MATTPFDFWAGMWRSGQAMVETSARLAETMQASGSVIDSRSRTMFAASRDPLHGDYVELNRMVPEKLAAFSKAGASAMGDLQAIQANAIANWQMMLRMAAYGRLPTSAEMATMTSRSATMIERTAKAAGKALAPVHRGATGNARRLAKARTR